MSKQLALAVTFILLSISARAQFSAPNSNGVIHYNGGDVGIGLTNPSALLHIGKDTESKLRLGSNPHLIIQKNSDKFRFQIAGEGYSGLPMQLGRDDGNNNIFIPGKLGIGNPAPQVHTHLMDASTLSLRVERANNSSIDLKAGASTYGAGLTLLSGDRMFFTTNQDITEPEMTLVNGKLGIGLRAPEADLHILGIGNTRLIVERDNSNSSVELVSSAPIHGAGLSLLSGDRLFLTTNSDITTPDFVIKNGNVGIATEAPDSKLTVAGKIHAQEVKVSVDAGADFVFEEDYSLTSLEELDLYVKENKHLPEIASAKEMETDGIHLAEMNIKLLQKIEELTLHLIEQNTQLQNQNNQIIEMRQQLDQLMQD